jgi:hypothetical protein
MRAVGLTQNANRRVRMHVACVTRFYCALLAAIPSPNSHPNA